MKLQSLWIHNIGNDALRASVEFKSAYGKVELNLPPDTSARVLALVADLIVESAKETALVMTKDVLEHVEPTKVITHEV